MLHPKNSARDVGSGFENKANGLTERKAFEGRAGLPGLLEPCSATPKATCDGRSVAYGLFCEGAEAKRVRHSQKE